MGKHNPMVIHVRLFHPIDHEIRFLKQYYGKGNLSDPEFIRWFIHYTYLSLIGG